MKEILVFLILICIIGLALYYIYKSKKNGAKCIGCPYSKTCNKEEKCL
ncbi:MAG: FeoB-associated Cys-rich membrane protein [Clostridia bacterium]|nr:FeoB-associated Cys-rich membrane protein [Clostridia bacterium]